MTSFEERQKSLFNHLKDAEEQCSFSKSNKAKESNDYSVMDKQSYRKLKHQMKQFRGKESIFKRPEANIRECLQAKTKPDYIKNPQNWTYYSLADVTQEQMSDATNTATALALMQEMEEREAANTTVGHEDVDIDETGATFKKPMFKASKTIKANNSTNEETMVFKQGKIIMPEYVVGVSQKKEKKKSVVKTDNIKTRKVELKLNHLYDDDNDIDDPDS